MSNYQHEDEVSSGMLTELKQTSQTFQNKYQDGKIDIDLSNIEGCDEKEMIISFKISEDTSNEISHVWQSVLSKLGRCNLSTLDDGNEWFDEYSIYTTKSAHTLIKNETDFKHYFQQCINMSNNPSDPVTTSTTVPIIVKVSFILARKFFCFFCCVVCHFLCCFFLFLCKNINWVDEYKYINNWLIDNGNETKIFIKGSDKYIDCLIDHFVNRIKVLEKIIDYGDDEINTKLSEEETRVMTCLFDRLIALRKEEGMNQSDGCLQFIEKAKESLQSTDDIDSLEEVIKQLKNVLDKRRLFNVAEFLQQYKKHELSCQLLSNENVVLFIGSTGAGKSTTIYFLTGAEMEKDEYNHIRAKNSKSLSKELLNVKLQRSTRSSVTTDITPVTVMLNDELSQYPAFNDDDCNNNKMKLKDKVIFCDTPGFGDTKGDAIDIANKFGLIGAMQLSSFVRIVVVISREDIVRKMEGLKKLSDELYQYLSNYRSMQHNSDRDLENKPNDDNNNSKPPIAIENDTFMEKLKDINIIFTQFASIKAINCYFSNSDMKKLEKEHKENKNAFYYLNKYINSLVKNDGIILIDPIEGEYKQALYNIFVSSDAKWIKTAENNFEAGIAPEKMRTIKEQVGRHCKYIEAVIDHNTSIIFGGSNIHKNVNFDYFRLVQHKMDELKEMCNILGDGIVAYSNTIQNVTNHWNKICDLTIDKAIQCCKNNTQEDMNDTNIQEYKEHIGAFKDILEQLLVKHGDFCQNYLENGKTQEEMTQLIYDEFIALLNNSKLGFINTINNNSDTNTTNTNDGVTQQHKQPHVEKKQDITTIHNDTTNIAGNSNDSNSYDEADNIDNNINSLLQCLVILEYFGNEMNDEFDKYLKQLYDECLDYIDKHDFESVVSVLKLFDAVLNNNDDLKSKRPLSTSCNNIKKELKKWIDLKLDIVKTDITKIDSNNSHETKQDADTSSHDQNETLNKIEKEYNAIYRCCDTLGQYCVSDEIIQPQETMQIVDKQLKQCCQSMEKNIDKHLNDAATQFDVIQQLIHNLNGLMKICDKNSNVDDILNKIVKNIGNLDKIIDEMKWMIEYHSNKDRLAHVFKSGIISSKINDLNDYISHHRCEINLSAMKESQKHIKLIVSLGIAVGRCYYDGYKLIYGSCDINKVIELIDPSVAAIRTRIDEIAAELPSIELFKEREKENEESKADQTKLTNMKGNVGIGNEKANTCLEILEQCKKLSLCNSDDGEFSIQICLVTQATRTTVEKYFKHYFENRGQWLCKSITNGLIYFDDLLNNLVANADARNENDNAANDSNYHLSDAGYYARSIAEIDGVELSWKQYKLLNDYLFADKDMGSLITQWKRRLRIIHDKLAKITSNKKNSSMVISPALIMCKKLTIIDSCCILEKDATFNSLAQKIESLIDQECRQLTESIEKRNFDAVFTQFKQQQKQLIVAEMYDIPRKYLANEMIDIVKQIKTLVKEIPETKLDKYSCETRETMDRLIGQICKIMNLELIEYIDDKSKNKWDQTLEELFVQATSSANVMLHEISENVKQSQYDKLQAQIEILNEMESKLMTLQPFFKTGKYKRSEQEIKTKAGVIQKKLKQDVIKLNDMDIDKYYELSQPSILCKALSSAVDNITQFKDSNYSEQADLIQYYKQARKLIEQAFLVVFEGECKNIMRIEKCWYKHSGMVGRCRELAESLPVGCFKDQAEAILNEMQREFDQMKQKDDDTIVSSFKTEKKSFMNKMRDVNNSFWGVATHSSKLSDVSDVYKEYLQRVKYNDQNMKQRLIDIILDRTSNEKKEIESYLSDNKSFSADLSSIINLHKRLDKFKRDVTSTLGDKWCEPELKCSISDIISNALKTNHKDIGICKDGVKSQLNKIEVIQKWFAHKECVKDVREQFVLKLSTYILRLIKGLLYYCVFLQSIIDLTNIETPLMDTKRIEKEVCDLLNQFFCKWIDDVEKMIASNNFEGCKTNLETILAFENDEGMKQIRSSIYNGTFSLQPFNCNTISIVLQNHLKSIANKILDEQNGLGIVNGGHIEESMQMRVRRYEKLKKNLTILRSSSIIDKYFDNYSHLELYSKCIGLMSGEINHATEWIASQINKPSEQSFRSINHLFNNLMALGSARVDEHLKNDGELQTYIGIVRNKIVSKLQQIEKEASSKYASLDKIKTSMIILQMAKHILTHNHFRSVVTNAMENVLRVQKQQHGIVKLSQLFVDLNVTSDEKSDSDAYSVKSNNKKNVYWCKEIINSFPIFSGTLIYLFNIKQGKNGQDIDSALNRIMIDKSGDTALNDSTKKRLKSFYLSFDEEYWKLIHKYAIDCNIKKDKDLNGKLKKLCKNIRCLSKNYNITHHRKVIQLMAHIFCVWTMLDCGHFLGMKKTETSKYYLRQPTATQALAVMRLVGINEAMKSNLIEIQPGEGKSLVLAVGACVFALLGMNVYHISYSQLLTSRDFSKFQDLFIQLKVVNKIYYTTYLDMCKSVNDAIACSDQDILKLLSVTSNYTYDTDLHNVAPSKPWNANETILLIDEVDVLFNEKYFGKSIWRYVHLRHKVISQITDLIWNLHNSKELYEKFDSNQDKIMQMIKQSDVYDACITIFGFWIPLIDKEIEKMIRDVQRFELASHKYVVNKKLNQIGYLHEDRIVYGTIVDYKTMFAYYKEHQIGNISKKVLQAKKHISLRNGSISCAEFPCRFTCIAGVSSTLSQLGISHKEFLANKYQINKYSYMATMYEKNQLQFDALHDVAIVDNENWGLRLVEDVNKRMGARKPKRPVLIFFENNGELQQFWKKFCTDDGCQCLILNEELTINEKNTVIKDSCHLNTITLCTRIFGRGTDFIVADDRVNKMGGVHVIQTFFSDNISEEIQIKGRTARNGGNGSFSMVLNREKISIVGNSYDQLNKRRIRLGKERNDKALEEVKRRKIYHDKTIMLTQHINQEKRKSVLKLLTELNDI